MAEIRNDYKKTGINSIRWVGPRAGLNILEKRKFFRFHESMAIS
jgi:hypothetical protein